MHRHVAKIPPKPVRHITAAMVETVTSNEPLIIEGAIPSVEVPMPSVEIPIKKEEVVIPTEKKVTKNKSKYKMGGSL